MRKLIIALIASFMFIAAPAMADQIDLSGLSETQQAQIKLEIAKQAESNKQSTMSQTTVEQINQYAELGKNYGIAMAEVAKQLGVAGDEILKSTAGKIAMVLIVWKFIGASLLHLIIGSVWFSVMLTVWFWLLNKFVIKSRAFTERFDKDGKLTTREFKPFEFDGFNSAWTAILVIMFVLMTIVGLVILFV